MFLRLLLDRLRYSKFINKSNPINDLISFLDKLSFLMFIILLLKF